MAVNHDCNVIILGYYVQVIYMLPWQQREHGLNNVCAENADMAERLGLFQRKSQTTSLSSCRQFQIYFSNAGKPVTLEQM